MGSGEDSNAASGMESHDFTNVASFSELPFLRSAPTQQNSTSGIRIFGIDVPHTPTDLKRKETAAATNAVVTYSTTTTTSNGSSSTGTAVPDSSRKFECHYCCRHFPTSQALGGHQNAHKRERQHAKRIQMQSAMAAAAASGSNHHLHGYPQHLFQSYPASPTMSTLYSSWPSVRGNNIGIGPRFYNGLGSTARPINGNPSPAGLWRTPTAVEGNVTTRDTHVARQQMPLPLFRGDEQSRGVLGYPSALPLTSPQGQFVCDLTTTAAMQENVSLDLHL